LARRSAWPGFASRSALLPRRFAGDLVNRLTACALDQETRKILPEDLSPVIEIYEFLEKEFATIGLSCTKRKYLLKLLARIVEELLTNCFEEQPYFWFA